MAGPVQGENSYRRRGFDGNLRPCLRRVLVVVPVVIALVLAGCQTPTREQYTPNYPTAEDVEIETTPAHEKEMPDYDPPEYPEDRAPELEVNMTEVELLVIELLNEERAERGLSEVTHDPRLSAVARNRSDRQAERGYISHWISGTRYDHQLQQTNYDCGPGTENVASTNAGLRIEDPRFNSPKPGTNESRLAEAVFNQWMDSDPHREGMLTNGQTTIGMGAYIKDKEEGRGTMWWMYSTMIICA